MTQSIASSLTWNKKMFTTPAMGALTVTLGIALYLTGNWAHYNHPEEEKNKSVNGWYMSAMIATWVGLVYVFTYAYSTIHR